MYYGDHDDNPVTDDVFYTLVNGIKTPIDVSQTIINTITNMDNRQINVVKNELGNTIIENSSVFTGDTYVDNGVTYYVYKGEYSTTVIANTARTTGVTLDLPAYKILSLDINYGTGLTASVTDVTVVENALSLKLGVGKIYQVLANEDTSVKVMIEFASSAKPIGL